MGEPDPGVPHRGVESNVVAFVLQPAITVPATVPLAGGVLTVGFTPAAGRAQRVTLYLHEHNAPDDRPARAYSFPAPRDNGILDSATETASIAFPIANIVPGDYLAFVHDLPLQDYLTPNPVLRDVIASLPTRNLIFTNADVNHARRVLTALQLDDLFETIVDVNAVTPYCKPMPESFAIAMDLADEPDPRKCVMIDDLPRTTRAALNVGMASLLYGCEDPTPDASGAFTDWNHLPLLLGDP